LETVVQLKALHVRAFSSIKGAANLFLQVEGKSADGEAVLWDDPQ